jgi:2-keto-4-pentenoate hydratase
VEDAYCAQDKYVALLAKQLGPRIGYKIAFAGKAAQERFGVKEPARGVMFRSMILANGAVVDPKFGVGGLFEPDLIVTVKDAGINDAKTPLDAAEHLDQVVTFFELPDLILAKGATVNGPNIIAINAGARFGVEGQGVKVQPTQAFVDAFAKMEAVLIDDTGKERARTKGETLMGNPLNALLWLIDSLRASGQRMEPGDHISLGSLGAIIPPEPGRGFVLRYEGLPGGTPEVAMSFK